MYQIKVEIGRGGSLTIREFRDQIDLVRYLLSLLRQALRCPWTFCAAGAAR